MDKDHLKENLKAAVKDYNDFPTKGIVFKDICPIFNDPLLTKTLFDVMSDDIKDIDFTHLVGLESRGFLFLAPLAITLEKKFMLIRKPGKLPGKVISRKYKKEYGEDFLEVQDGVLNENCKCLIVDDLLATGGTAEAAAELILQAGGKIAGFVFLIELNGLNGMDKLQKFGGTTEVILKF